MRKRKPECHPLCELVENKMVRNCTRLYPGRHPCDVVEYLHVGEQMTLQQIAAHLGVGTRTVWDWLPAAGRGFQNHSQAERERLRAWMQHYNQDIRCAQK